MTNPPSFIEDQREMNDLYLSALLVICRRLNINSAEILNEHNRLMGNYAGELHVAVLEKELKEQNEKND